MNKYKADREYPRHFANRQLPVPSWLVFRLMLLYTRVLTTPGSGVMDID